MQQKRKKKIDKQDVHEEIADLENALEYTQKNFLSCSEQRIATFRYFIIFMAAVAYGLYELYEHAQVLNLYVFILVILSFFITWIFFFIELRNKEIIEKNRDACIMLEGVLAEAVRKEIRTKNFLINEDKHLSCLFEKDKLQVLKRTKEERKCSLFLSYGNLLGIFFVLILITHVFMMIFIINCNKDLFSNFCGKTQEAVTGQKTFKISDKLELKVDTN